MSYAQTAAATGGGMTAAVQEEIIRVALHSYERLPLFEIVMDRAVQALGPALRSVLDVQADVELRAVDYMACGDALAAAPDPGLITLAHASPWDGTLAVTVDPALLFATLEIMLGASDRDETGESTTSQTAWAPRAFTTIEKRLGAQLVGLALREVAAAFAPLDRVSFTAGAIESGPRDVVLAPLAAGCVRVTIRIAFEGRGGDLCLIVPHRTLDAVRSLLAQVGAAGQFGSDPGWRSKLLQSLNDTPVTLTAVLHDHVVSLADMLGWQPGRTLDLGIDSTHEVAVSCSGKEMFRAAIGRRRNGSVALRVTAVFEANEDEGANGFAD